MTESWPHDRVSVDLLKRDRAGALKLTTIGSRKDLALLGIELHDGLRLPMWTDDLDDRGELDPILLEGNVRWNQTSASWVVDVDQSSVRHRSDEERIDRDNSGSGAG